VTVPPQGQHEERNTELRQLFFENAQELLQTLNEQALRLEQSPGDVEAIRSVRRAVHTLKGDAAACGYRELSELAHELEDVLTLDSAAAATSLPDLALRAADLFAAMLDAYRGKRKLPDVQPLRQAIADLASRGAAYLGGARKSPQAPAHVFRWSEYERLAIRSALEAGRRVCRVSVQLDPQCGMPIAARQMIRVALAALGEVLALHPAEGNPGPLERLEFALASEKPAVQIRSRCQIPTVSIHARVASLRSKASQRRPPVPGSAGSEPASQSVSAASKGAPKIRPAVTTLHESPVQTLPGGPDNILRVDAERIDSVLNLVGEMILAKSMLQQTLNEFSDRFSKDSLRGKFSDAMAFQARVLNDLQRSVMKIRMVPVEQLFRRFPRVVRDVALQCGKQVELIVNGEHTDLDKSILDAIAEPLTHLVRNAIGHGIEGAEERVKAGKRPQGSLQLNAYHQGNHVVIEVSDDGHGIDVAKVRQRALSQGLVTPEQAARLSEDETLELILSPGFSTAEEITELSGRGVGLDVVHSVLQRLKGTVQIQTTPGRGTTFRLQLPLTLAIIKALLFRVEKRLYAIPLNGVVEIARTRKEEIHQVEHYEVLQLRNEVLPLMRLGPRSAPVSPSASPKIFVLVISTGGRKFGLIVDALEGEDELVIKALDDQSISTDLVSGASILGNGRVVLILNLSALAERFTRTRSADTGDPAAGLLGPGADRALRGRSMAGGQA
jgi:two-component system, chemotaxis family, sensor kinase CheA